MEVSEVAESVEEAAHHHKWLVVMISILAVLLALVEMSASNQLNLSNRKNVESADLWAFYQAKSIRMNTLRTSVQSLEALSGVLGVKDAAPLHKQVEEWNATIEHLEGDAATHDGRKELEEKARETEEIRNEATERGEHFELAAAALQIALVLASTAVVTGRKSLASGSVLLGAIGTALSLWSWVGMFL